MAQELLNRYRALIDANDESAMDDSPGGHCVTHPEDECGKAWFENPLDCAFVGRVMPLV